MGTTATQRTLRALRKQGRICAVVERFNNHVGDYGIRQDLFGFIDVIALEPSGGIIGVQCMASGLAAHKKKILNECHDNAAAWLKSGGKIELWYWRKLKLVRGGKKQVWRPRIEKIILSSPPGVKEHQTLIVQSRENLAKDFNK